MSQARFESGQPDRWLWAAIGLALLGRWVHAFAQAWLMFELTGSALWLAVGTGVAALSALPVVGWRGRRIVSVSPFRQLALAHGGLILVALLCAALLAAQLLRPWHLLMTAAAYGCLAAIEAPALAAVVGASAQASVRQVAAARHALLFNGMRGLAPVLAGGLIATLGAAACFVFNAACLLPILVLALRWPSRWRPPCQAARQADRTRQVRPLTLLISAALLSALALPVTALLPVIAHQAAGNELASLSRLSSGLGIGALGAALLLCLWRPQSAAGNRAALRAGLMLAGLALLGRSGLEPPWGQVAWGVALGAAISGVLGICMCQIQSLSQRRLRARVLAWYAAIQLGLTPLAGLITAGLADVFGISRVLPVAGAVLLIYAVMAGRLDARTSSERRWWPASSKHWREKKIPGIEGAGTRAALPTIAASDLSPSRGSCL